MSLIPTLVGKLPSEQRVFNVKAFGAIGDGIKHPLSERYALLSDAQKIYPRATDLSEPICWHATQLAIDTALTQGGGWVYGPTGRYVCTGAPSAFIFPMADDRQGSPKSTATKAPVSLLGDGDLLTGWLWKEDRAGSTVPGDHFAVMCGNAPGDPNNQQVGTRYEFNAMCAGTFKDLFFEGPFVSSASGVIGTNMSGICWAGRRVLTNVRVSGFYSGVDLVGDHTTFTNIKLYQNYYNLYMNHNSPSMYGDLVLTGKSVFENARMACVAFHYGGSMGTWHVTERCFFGTSPYVFFKEATPDVIPAGYKADNLYMAGVQFDSPFFEGVGNAVFWDDNYTVSGRCLTTLEGVRINTGSWPSWKDDRRIKSRDRCHMLVGAINGCNFNLRKFEATQITRPMFDITNDILGSFVISGDIELYIKSCTELTNPFSQLMFAVVANGGTGYAVGDRITLAGGALYADGIGACVLRVNSIGAGGAVTNASVLSWGQYSTAPTNPVAQNTTTGVGTGATFTMTSSNRGMFVRPPNDLTATRVEFDHCKGDGSCGPWKGRLQASYAGSNVPKNVAVSKSFYGINVFDGRIPTNCFAGISRSAAMPVSAVPSGNMGYVVVAESGVDIPVSVSGTKGQELRKVNSLASGGQIVSAINMTDGLVIGWGNLSDRISLFNGAIGAHNATITTKPIERSSVVALSVVLNDWSKFKLITNLGSGVLSASVTAENPGTGYAVNDTITISGGTLATGGVAAVLRVTTIGGGGAITGVVVVNQGQYSALPANPLSQSTTSGTGTGATFTGVFGGSDVPITLAKSLPAGYEVDFAQDGTGRLSFVAESGATLLMNGNYTAGRYSGVKARVVSNTTGTNAEWIVTGQLVV